MSTKSFQEQLEEIYLQYRHGELENRLEDLTEQMEQTILQRVLAEEFLETDIEIEEDAKQAVTIAEQYLEKGDYESLSEEIDDIEAAVSDQERKVNNRIHEARISMSETLGGMKRLNERVDRVSDVKLEAIATLLDDWNWKEHVYREEDAGMDTLKEYARDYGKDMRTFFEESKEELFKPYTGTPLESIVKGMLTDERYSLHNLSDEEVELLRDDPIAEYVELKLT
ncbi:hypothetical protein [Haladaptatus sp. YSMS36]|uniref:hypothetical protein n=1 Tax=Haladaptatus sp. YSMS36 TaxID=3033384 RepID=UPI0023E8E00D|nr:hypothetical protein [Haladaptatus sp. YSMS36]